MRAVQPRAYIHLTKVAQSRIVLPYDCHLSLLLHKASLVPAGIMFFIDMVYLKPAVEELSMLTQTTLKSQREYAATTLLTQLKTFHMILVPIILTTILLQIQGAKFHREFTAEEEAAAADAKKARVAAKKAAGEKEKKPEKKEDPETRAEKELRQRLRKEHAEKTARQLAKAEAKANKKVNAKEQDMWNSSKATSTKGKRR